MTSKAAPAKPGSDAKGGAAGKALPGQPASQDPVGKPVRLLIPEHQHPLSQSPLWSNKALLDEKWESNTPGGLFEDPAGFPLLPQSFSHDLDLHWMRPTELFQYYHDFDAKSTDPFSSLPQTQVPTNAKDKGKVDPKAQQPVSSEDKFANQPFLIKDSCMTQDESHIDAFARRRQLHFEDFCGVTLIPPVAPHEPPKDSIPPPTTPTTPMKSTKPTTTKDTKQDQSPPESVQGLLKIGTATGAQPQLQPIVNVISASQATRLNSLLAPWKHLISTFLHLAHRNEEMQLDLETVLRGEEESLPDILWSSIYPQNESGQPQLSPTGKYIVRLWVDGEWRMIVVDDRLPVCLRTKPVNKERDVRKWVEYGPDGKIIDSTTFDDDEEAQEIEGEQTPETQISDTQTTTTVPPPCLSVLLPLACSSTTQRLELWPALLIKAILKVTSGDEADVVLGSSPVVVSSLLGFVPHTVSVKHSLLPPPLTWNGHQTNNRDRSETYPSDLNESQSESESESGSLSPFRFNSGPNSAFHSGLPTERQQAEQMADGASGWEQYLRSAAHEDEEWFLFLASLMRGEDPSLPLFGLRRAVEQGMSEEELKNVLFSSYLHSKNPNTLKLDEIQRKELNIWTEKAFPEKYTLDPPPPSVDSEGSQKDQQENDTPSALTSEPVEQSDRSESVTGSSAASEPPLMPAPASDALFFRLGNRHKEHPPPLLSARIAHNSLIQKEARCLGLDTQHPHFVTGLAIVRDERLVRLVSPFSSWLGRFGWNDSANWNSETENILGDVFFERRYSTVKVEEPYVDDFEIAEDIIAEVGEMGDADEDDEDEDERIVAIRKIKQKQRMREEIRKEREEEMKKIVPFFTDVKVPSPDEIEAEVAKIFGERDENGVRTKLPEEVEQSIQKERMRIERKKLEAQRVVLRREFIEEKAIREDAIQLELLKSELLEEDSDYEDEEENESENESVRSEDNMQTTEREERLREEQEVMDKVEAARLMQVEQDLKEYSHSSFAFSGSLEDIELLERQCERLKKMEQLAEAVHNEVNKVNELPPDDAFGEDGPIQSRPLTSDELLGDAFSTTGEMEQTASTPSPVSFEPSGVTAFLKDRSILDPLQFPIEHQPGKHDFWMPWTDFIHFFDEWDMFHAPLKQDADIDTQSAAKMTSFYASLLARNKKEDETHEEPVIPSLGLFATHSEFLSTCLDVDELKAAQFPGEQDDPDAGPVSQKFQLTTMHKQQSTPTDQPPAPSKDTKDAKKPPAKDAKAKVEEKQPAAKAEEQPAEQKEDLFPCPPKAQIEEMEDADVCNVVSVLRRTVASNVHPLTRIHLAEYEEGMDGKGAKPGLNSGRGWGFKDSTNTQTDQAEVKDTKAKQAEKAPAGKKKEEVVTQVVSSFTPFMTSSEPIELLVKNTTAKQGRSLLITLHTLPAAGQTEWKGRDEKEMSLLQKRKEKQKKTEQQNTANPQPSTPQTTEPADPFETIKADLPEMATLTIVHVPSWDSSPSTHTPVLALSTRRVNSAWLHLPQTPPLPSILFANQNTNPDTQTISNSFYDRQFTLFHIRVVAPRGYRLTVSCPADISVSLAPAANFIPSLRFLPVSPSGDPLQLDSTSTNYTIAKFELEGCPISDKKRSTPELPPQTARPNGFKLDLHPASTGVGGTDASKLPFVMLASSPVLFERVCDLDTRTIVIPHGTISMKNFDSMRLRAKASETCTDKLPPPPDQLTALLLNSLLLFPRPTLPGDDKKKKKERVERPSSTHDDKPGEAKQPLPFSQDAQLNLDIKSLLNLPFGHLRCVFHVLTPASSVLEDWVSLSIVSPALPSIEPLLQSKIDNANTSDDIQPPAFQTPLPTSIFPARDWTILNMTPGNRTNLVELNGSDYPVLSINLSIPTQQFPHFHTSSFFPNPFPFNSIGDISPDVIVLRMYTKKPSAYSLLQPENMQTGTNIRKVQRSPSPSAEFHLNLIHQQLNLPPPVYIPPDTIPVLVSQKTIASCLDFTPQSHTSTLPITHPHPAASLAALAGAGAPPATPQVGKVKGKGEEKPVTTALPPSLSAPLFGPDGVPIFPSLPNWTTPGTFLTRSGIIEFEDANVLAAEEEAELNQSVQRDEDEPEPLNATQHSIAAPLRARPDPKKEMAKTLDPKFLEETHTPFTKDGKNILFRIALKANPATQNAEFPTLSPFLSLSSLELKTDNPKQLVALTLYVNEERKHKTADSPSNDTPLGKKPKPTPAASPTPHKDLFGNSIKKTEFKPLLSGSMLYDSVYEPQRLPSYTPLYSVMDAGEVRVPAMLLRTRLGKELNEEQKEESEKVEEKKDAKAKDGKDAKTAPKKGKEEIKPDVTEPTEEMKEEEDSMILYLLEGSILSEITQEYKDTIVAERKQAKQAKQQQAASRPPSAAPEVEQKDTPKGAKDKAKPKTPQGVGKEPEPFAEEQLTDTAEEELHPLGLKWRLDVASSVPFKAADVSIWANTLQQAKNRWKAISPFGWNENLIKFCDNEQTAEDIVKLMGDKPLFKKKDEEEEKSDKAPPKTPKQPAAKPKAKEAEKPVEEEKPREAPDQVPTIDELNNLRNTKAERAKLAQLSRQSFLMTMAAVQHRIGEGAPDENIARLTSDIQPYLNDIPLVEKDTGTPVAAAKDVKTEKKPAAAKGAKEEVKVDEEEGELEPYLRYLSILPRLPLPPPPLLVARTQKERETERLVTNSAVKFIAQQEAFYRGELDAMAAHVDTKKEEAVEAPVAKPKAGQKAPPKKEEVPPTPTAETPKQEKPAVVAFTSDMFSSDEHELFTPHFLPSAANEELQQEIDFTSSLFEKVIANTHDIENYLDHMEKERVNAAIVMRELAFRQFAKDRMMAFKKKMEKEEEGEDDED
ncbi:hypothetical protein BLNAU_16012 [Blattamonas nauphoetae]|uniref:Calpain catalytic domain-containing protein n=1 Tax=Blattamonas nauphoetae TaxID=2049346 RepID=A0ABQ9X8W8_9EUKA|nr:hypothetical protein BLNAU_16012 [Blattamonas nauphoetae]